MLRLRIATAVALLAVMVVALVAGPMAVAAGAGALFGVALYEWLRLVGHRSALCVAAGALLGLLLFAGEWLSVRPAAAAMALIAGGATAIWLALVVVLVQAERQAMHVGRAAATMLGALLLVAAALSFLHLYRQGAIWLLSVLALVWIADIAAYFGGRAFGRRKLAPRLSPGKTLAGLVSALCAVAVCALALRLWLPEMRVFSTRLLEQLPVVAALLLLLALVLLSITGDLFESLMKRQAGVKDSGRLLPGHGGVLDRIDALLPVLPAAALIQQWVR